MRNDALRKQCLTASEFPALMGIDPYGRTPLSLFLEKLGLVDPQPDHPVLRWGRLIEAACLQAYAEDCQCVTREVDTTQHATYHWLAATPDALVGEDRGVEVKTVGPRRIKDWQSGIPTYVLVQVAINMAVFDRPYWDVGRLFLSNRDWLIIPVERDRELEGLLIEAGERFRHEYWLPQTPPPVDGSLRTAQYQARKYARHTEEMIKADTELQALIALYHQDQRKRAVLKKAMQLRRNQLKERIGGKAGVIFPGGKITWKQSRPSLKTDWEGLAKVAHYTAEQFATYTEERPGSRRFVVTFEKDQA